MGDSVSPLLTTDQQSLYPQEGNHLLNQKHIVCSPTQLLCSRVPAPRTKSPSFQQISQMFPPL